MRKICLVTTIVLISAIVPMLSFAQDDEPPEVREYIVIGENVNLRAAPNTSAQILGQVTSGMSVFVYADSPADGDWFRLYRTGEVDAYIAAFLVEPAPVRFFAPDPPPEVIFSGSGTFTLEPAGFQTSIYRLDVEFTGTSLQVNAIPVQDTCTGRTLLNIAIPRASVQVASTFFAPAGCQWQFAVNSTASSWMLTFRDISGDANTQLLVDVVDGLAISASGTQLTMPLRFTQGTWRIDASVADSSFVLYALPREGDCDSRSLIFNDLIFSGNLNLWIEDFQVGPAGCVVYLQTDNVDAEWTLSFRQVVTTDTSSQDDNTE